jgi:hypothetical protein
MLDKLLSVVATNAKLVVAGAIGAALVAGGGAVAVTQVASSSDATPTATIPVGGAAGAEHRSATATAGIAVPNAPKAPKSTDANETDGAQGVHGACVSAVAKASPAADAQPGDHGKLVSAAAKSCPGNGSTTSDAARKAAAAKKAAGKANKPGDDTTEDTGRPADPGSQGADNSSGRGQSGTHP